MTTKPSLRDRICGAKTVQELERLWEEGVGYKRASYGTVTSWLIAIAKRRIEIDTGQKL